MSRYFNFFRPDLDLENWRSLCEVAFTLSYQECEEIFKKKGIYINPEQFESLQNILNIQMNMETGSQCGEGYGVEGSLDNLPSIDEDEELF